MASRIEIDPVTRVEGHAKITLWLGDNGKVQDAQLHIAEFRGFEKFCEGRPFTEMPSLMARICGICPVSHLIASAKACDAILAVDIPETAKKLRRLLHLAQVVQSHALSFFHLSSPDLLLGMDADPAQRNILGLAAANPTVARDGIRLRQLGQQIIATLGGKRIHPAWIVPGGVTDPLTPERRDEIGRLLPEAKTIIQRTLGWWKPILGRYQEEIQHFANFPSLYMGLVGEGGTLEFYDGDLRVVDATGMMIQEARGEQYESIIGEAVEPWSYLKFPYYRPLGYPQGLYRVGPLARLNVVTRCGTSAANDEWQEFRAMSRRPVASSFHYHYARLIEILHAVERMSDILRAADITSPHVRALAGPNRLEGIGVSEAPRGTLIHHYRINEQGLIASANLIIATGHNNLAMNRGVLDVARHFVDGRRLTEGMLNRVEAVVRAFDPCLSCSTHALGHMPLRIELRDGAGRLVDQAGRG